MKIYTKTGDTGTTGLFGGARVAKDAVRIEAYGTIDELNASLGAAISFSEDSQCRKILTRLQGELMVVGADLATPLGPIVASSTAISNIPRVTEEMILVLEREIDRFTEEAGELTTFILPGGSPAGASIHQARCICRRAERIITHLAREEALTPHIGPYINRLSDHLFELARLANHRAGVPEIAWSRASVMTR